MWLCYQTPRTTVSSVSGVQESLSCVEVLMSGFSTCCLTALAPPSLWGLLNMQGLLRRLVPLVTTEPKSCSGSHKGLSEWRHWIAMDEQVQQRDLWACEYGVCACVCVDCDVNNNSFRSPAALSVGKVTANPHFCRQSTMPRGEEMSFLLKLCLIQQITFLSILGDCTQLGYLDALTICGDCLPIFTAWLIIQCCYDSNLYTKSEFTLRVIVYISSGPKWFHIISTFLSSQPWTLK